MRRALIFALALTVAAPAAAHHSFAMFDLKKNVTVEGSVVQFKWQNPHAWIEFDARVNGKVERWSIELNSPNNLIAEGWKRTSLKTGDRATLIVHPLRDGQKGGTLLGLRRADGTVLGEFRR